jgi:hypothetical protein
MIETKIELLQAKVLLIGDMRCQRLLGFLRKTIIEHTVVFTRV